MKEEELQLIKEIHDIARGNFTWQESWNILARIVKSHDTILLWELEVMMLQLYKEEVN